MLDLEFSQKLLFVTGKGGTGKSFLTSVLGVRYAEEGKRVLLIDAEATGAIAEQFEHASIGYEPVEVAKNIFVLQSNTDEALAEYLNLYAKIPTWAKLTPLARLIDLVSNAAPGVREILITGKVCYEAKKMLDGDSDFDIIVVDAPSSGHVISILDAPRALSELVSRGMIQNQTSWMQEILADKEITGVLVATTTDEVVLAETHDLVGKIKDSTEVDIAGIIINKDVADLGISAGKVEVVKNPSSKLDKVRNFYLARIEQTRLAIEQFERFPLFAVPLINDSASSLRSLMKNAHRFVSIEKDSK